MDLFKILEDRQLHLYELIIKFIYYLDLAFSFKLLLIVPELRKRSEFMDSWNKGETLINQCVNPTFDFDARKQRLIRLTEFD